MSSTDWRDKGRVEKAYKGEVEGQGEDSFDLHMVGKGTAKKFIHGMGLVPRMRKK